MSMAPPGLGQPSDYDQSTSAGAMVGHAVSRRAPEGYDARRRGHHNYGDNSGDDTRGRQQERSGLHQYSRSNY